MIIYECQCPRAFLALDNGDIDTFEAAASLYLGECQASGEEQPQFVTPAEFQAMAEGLHCFGPFLSLWGDVWLLRGDGGPFVAFVQVPATQHPVTGMFEAYAGGRFWKADTLEILQELILAL